MQHRDPPAYQEYAASVLAKSEFRELSLQERGLLYTLKLECWVNKSLPSDLKKLAKYAGLPEHELAEIMPNIGHFFTTKANRISSPELDNYRAHLEKVSKARKKGADTTNAIKSMNKRYAQATNERSQDSRSSENLAIAKSTLASSVKSSSVQSSSMSFTTSQGTNLPISEYTYNPDEDIEL